MPLLGCTVFGAHAPRNYLYPCSVVMFDRIRDLLKLSYDLKVLLPIDLLVRLYRALLPLPASWTYASAWRTNGDFCEKAKKPGRDLDNHIVPFI